MTEVFWVQEFQAFWGGYVTSPSFQSGAIMVRLDENGDTIFTQKLNILGSVIPFLKPKFDGLYRVVVDARIPNGNTFLVCPAIVEFNESGAIFQTHIYSQFPTWRVTNAIQTNDFGMILGGSYNGRMASIKINFLGEVEWSSTWQPPASVLCEGNRLFQTGENQFLISGYLGRRIGGFTFDSLGTQGATKVFYETPSMRQFITGEATPSIDKSVVCSGYYKDGQNNSISYFGKVDSLGNKVWGGEQTIGFDYPQSNVDGTIWAMCFDPGNPMVTLKKFLPDSTLIKEIPVFQYGGFEAIWRQYLPIGNNQVIAVGYRNTSEASRQFLITKIDSFGVPITEVQNPIIKPPRTYPSIRIFPNPATTSVQFSNLNRQSLVSFYSLTGQRVFEKKILPEESIKVDALPKGSYLFRIKMGDQLFSGRFLKE